MLRNYVLTALRNILKYKLFSFINIAGLAVGLAAVMLITLYIWDEFTYDQFFAGSESIYKAELTMNSPGRGVRQMSATAGALAGGLVSDFSDDYVADAARLFNTEGVTTIGDNVSPTDFQRTDPSFFNIFELEYVEGDANTPMRDLSSVVLSRSAATRFFGNGPALGKVIDLDDGESYRVTAVFEDLPDNTHINLDVVFPIKPSEGDQLEHEQGWWAIGFNTYFTMHEGADVDALRASIPQMIDRYVEAPGNSTGPTSERYMVRLIPLGDVHFETAARNAGNPLMLAGFGAIALIILLIATFNFMNMSISRTVVRAREVAVRKAVGADRKHIISQFMSETLVTVTIALLVAVAITEVSLPWFNNFVAKLMTSGVLASPMFAAGILALVVLVALGAGFYPASIMSKFRPADVLRGGNSKSKSMSRFRTILVTGQFAVAIGLTIAATIVFQQIQYSQNMDPGFTKENVVLIHDLEHPSVLASAQSFKNRILEHPDVVAASLVDQAPGSSWGWITGINSVNGEQVEQMSMRGMNADPDFLDTLGISLRAGRGLEAARSGDYSRRTEGDYLPTANVLMNEKGIQMLGLGTPEEAVGKTFSDGTEYTIAGVIGDYLIGSSRDSVQAMYYIIDEQGYRMLALRFQSNNVGALMQYIDDAWAEIAGDRPIRREFLDERLARMYQVEERQGEIFAIFAGLAVLVSCIGLYGLASFSVAQRTKEIGLRKTMGASAGIITRQILWDFSKPVLIANLIAWPVAFYFMRDWLTNYSYRMDLDFLPFMMAAALALGVAWLTVGGHAIRVARANPIHALRYE
jgi:putative ABC transport system permease protein